jgi:hypothetical protein
VNQNQQLNKKMKKTIISAFALLSISAFSQTKKPFIIEHCKDNMTDKEYYLSSKKLVCANAEKTKGFTITPNFKKVDDDISDNGLILLNVRIGNCDENDQLIFLFEDDSKITLTSWNKFNCEGDAYFQTTDEEFKFLSSKLIKSIRFVNGYKYDTLTYNLKSTEKDFFVNAYNNYEIKEVSCND